MGFTGAALVFLFTLAVTLQALPATAAQELRAVRTIEPPRVDGTDTDPVWQRAPAVFSRDPVAHIDIELRAAHDGQRIYLLARFPDPTESRVQKELVWSPEEKAYRSGPRREDTLVLKWNMEPFAVDLSLSSDESYVADIWFWKAHRTDPVGYADDKIQRYSTTRTEHATQCLTKSGRASYLVRDGDHGDSAYEVLTYDRYVGDWAPKYRHRPPTGSRADIHAKGTWDSGVWTVEFSRALHTGHSDDIQLSKDLSYELGVSRYEIAARRADPSLEEALYGAGDIGPLLRLRFE